MISQSISKEISFSDACNDLRPESEKSYGLSDFQALGLLSESGKIRLEPAQRYFNDNDNYFPLLMDLFDSWKAQDDYVLLRHTSQDQEKPMYVALKCAKRGNDVYNWRLKQNFRWIYDKVKDHRFFNASDFTTDAKVKTKLLWVTLSYDVRREPNRRKAWRGIGEDWNRFISALRSKYGKIASLRSWEESKQGYPHIHAVLSFESKDFSVFPHFNDKEGRMTYRINEKHDLEPYWHSFIDVQAISSMKCLVNYVMKYQIKIHEGQEAGKYGSKTLAFMWLFRKRSYSVSGSFRTMFSDLIRDLRNSNMENLDEWEFLGVFSGQELGSHGEWVVSVGGDLAEKVALERAERESMRVTDAGIMNHEHSSFRSYETE